MTRIDFFPTPPANRAGRPHGRMLRLLAAARSDVERRPVKAR